MGRRSKRADLKLVGKTPEGGLIIGNVFAFYETHGLPLSDILFRLWCNDGCLPDWVGLVNDMVKSGRPLDRTIETISAAVHDACYPTDMTAGINERLHHLHNALKAVKTPPVG